MDTSPDGVPPEDSVHEFTAAIPGSMDANTEVDVPETVNDQNEDPTDRCGWWRQNLYLPRLRSTRWVGFVPGSMPPRFFHVGCGLADSVMLGEYGSGRPWCVVPTGSLGLRPATKSQAIGRKRQLLSLVARFGGNAVTLSWKETADVPAQVAGSMKETEPAILVIGLVPEALRRMAALIHQPFGLVPGPDGIPSPVDLRSGALVPTYVNAKGKTVTLDITRHARERLMLRSELLTPDVGAPIDVDWAIAELLRQSGRVTNLSIEERKRLGRYGGDTMFFRTSNFRLVVRNGAVITVEISAKEKRALNHLEHSANTSLGCDETDSGRLRWRVFMIVPDPERDWRVVECGWFDHEVPLEKLATNKPFHRFLRHFLQQRGLSAGSCRGVMVSRGRRGPQVEVKVPPLR
jgi:hypothetical protein